MASGEQLDGDPGVVPEMYFNSTEESRNALEAAEDAEHPLLRPVVQHAQAIANALSGYCVFLAEDSRPVNPAQIRNYMTQEMTAVWNIRRSLRDDLKLFTNANIIMILSRNKERARIIDDCIDELDSIRNVVTHTLGDDVRAAWDDLANEHASSRQRVESRAAVVRSLQGLAEKWFTFSEKLLLAQEIRHKKDSA
jgi:hypothetical protein